MLKQLLNRLAGRRPVDMAAGPREGVPFQLTPPDAVALDNGESFDLQAAMDHVHGLPVPAWHRVAQWVEGLPAGPLQAQAWSRAELAWLAHLQQALGPQYHLTRQAHALLLSPLPPREARAVVDFMTRTLSRITRVLHGVARAPAWGSDILLVFEDEDSYYRYVSRYYPDEGEFAFSGGMHINAGCSHFVTRAEDLRAIEPVIAHEMTHACLAHLPIPAWLNEGLAVNTERRLCPPMGERHTPQELNRMHRRFWTPALMQAFWSGDVFMRPDEGQLLSYDLARILVEQFAADWTPFASFANQAQGADAGAAAAAGHLGVDLGRAVQALFDLAPAQGWAPDPAQWRSEPQRGAFRGQTGRPGWYPAV